MAEVVNTTDMEVDCVVQDGGGGGEERYTLSAGQSITVEVESAKMTFTTEILQASVVSVEGVHNGDRVEVIDADGNGALSVSVS